ncbi:MAG: hypothetical protein AAGA01_06195, partial [Cyanobacteria bacterium P01_E01_bin.43]
MIRQWTALLLTVPLWIFALPSWAQGTRTISTETARGDANLITVELHPGHGVTLNFRPTEAFVRRAWLDDPSQVTLDFDDGRCLTTADDCAATVIHLRRIHPLEFPGLLATATTTLTVVTDSEVYAFQLAFPDSGSPSYRIVNIAPSNELQQPIAIAGTPGAQLVEQGLVVAQQRRLIAADDPLWERIQVFLQALRQGASFTEATQVAGISAVLVFQLAELGQQTSIQN